jgi:nucleoside-diphosphate-sugar epimerase
MKVVITGGTGFIGRMLARAILARGSLTGPSGAQEEVDAITLFDAVEPPAPLEGLNGRAKVVIGDISDQDLVSGLIDRDDVSVFHLASVVSGGGEKDFDLAIRVNLMGGLNVLEAARARAGRARAGAPRLVFASSIAVFGGSAMPAVVGDTTKQTPQTTYGVTKSIGELLINDYTRKGFIDGRAARLPTIVIRHLGEITHQPDAAIEAIVATWPVATEFARAGALGLPIEDGLDDIVRAYIEDFLDA